MTAGRWIRSIAYAMACVAMAGLIAGLWWLLHAAQTYDQYPRDVPAERRGR